MDEQTRTAVAEAILKSKSARYTTAHGRMLDLLTEIAERDDIVAFSKACHAYGTALPKSRRSLEDHAPGKILNAYLCRQPGVDQSNVHQLSVKDPGWPDRIRAALWTPMMLTGAVEDLLAQLRTLSGTDEKGLDQ